MSFIGSNNKYISDPGSVHILLCGHSFGHIMTVTRDFKPKHLEILTSEELLENANELIHLLKDISSSITVIPAFSSSSIQDSISRILLKYKDLRSLFPKDKIYFGITGGTNTMAVSVAYAALIAGVEMHYVLKPLGSAGSNEEIIFFRPKQIFEQLNENIHSKGGY